MPRDIDKEWLAEREEVRREERERVLREIEAEVEVFSMSVSLASRLSEKIRRLREGA